MPSSNALSKRRKPLVTYGRPLRPKFPSFKVFQDFIDEERAEKRRRTHSGYSHPLHPPAVYPQSTISQQVLGLASEVGDDPASKFGNPFVNRIPTHDYGLKLPQRAHTINTPSSIAHLRVRESKFETKALTEKSTNHPTLTQPTATSRVTIAGATFPHPLKREIRPSPKVHPTEKPRIGSQATPRLNLKAEPPRRPHKPRPTEPTLEDHDFPYNLSPSKACKSDLRCRFRRYSGISENGSNRPYNKPPTFLGITSIEINDNVSTVASTWVREKAKDMLSETKRAAKRILRVSPSDSKYKHQQHKEEKSRLEGVIEIGPKADFAVVINSQKLQKERVGCAAYNPSSPLMIGSTDEDVISLKDFLQDPFLSPQDYEVVHGMGAGVGQDHSLGALLRDTESSQTFHQRDLKRTESTRDLLMQGSAKMRRTGEVVLKGSTKPKLRAEDGTWDIFSSSLARTTPSPGGAYEFLHPPSDDEMPSSSPMFKSTPKKDWYQPRDSDTINTLLWKNNHKSDHREQDHANAMIIAFDSSDTDCVEGGELGNLHVGVGRGREYAKFFGKPRRNAVAMSIGRISDTGEDERTVDATVRIATKSDRDLKEVDQRQKRESAVYIDGLRTGRLVFKDKKPTMELGGTGGTSIIHNSSASNRVAVSKVTLKKISVGRTSRGAVKKDIRRRISPQGYEMINNDDVDELQMDLPAARI